MARAPRTALVPFILLSLCVGRPVRAQLQHLGYSPRDRLVDCVSKVFQKQVLREPDIPQVQPPAGCTGLSREQLRDSLRAQTIALMEEPDAVLLLSTLILPPYAPTIGEGSRVKWTHFRPVVSTKNDSLPVGVNERPLSPEELAHLQRDIVRQARLVPVFQTDGESLQQAEASFPVRIEVVVRHLKPGAPASLIAVVRGEETVAAGRLVYGEENGDGTYKLLWDSPLVAARYLDLSFDDVDGDGVQELILKSSFPGGMQDHAALTVFDRQGHELTRQQHCMQPDGYDFWPTFDSCPIVGEGVDFVYANNPPFDIAAMNVFYDRRDALFHLRNGRYVEYRPPARP